MTVLFFKLRRFILFSLAGVLIFIALSQGLLRLFLPVAHEQRARLENELGQLLKAEVSIGRIDSHWNYFVPYLDLLDVHIKQPGVPAGQPAQQLQRLSVGANLLDMLRAGSLAPSALQVDGLHVTIIKKANGDFYLPGLQLPEASDQPLDIDWDALISHKAVKLNNAHLELRHEGRGEALNFKQIQLQFRSSADGYQGALAWQPPAQLGEATHISFDLDGDLNNARSWRGEVDVQIPSMQLAALTRFFPKQLLIERGHIALSLGFRLGEQGLHVSRGLLDILAEFKSGEVAHWQGPIHAESEPGRVRLQVDSPLRVGQTPLNMLEGLGIDLLLQQDLAFGLSFDLLDLSRSAELLQALTHLPAPWPRRLHELHIKGQLHQGFAGWDSNNGWNLRGHLAGWQSQPVDGIPGLDGLNADMLYKEQVLTANLAEQQFQLDTGGLFPQPFAVQRLHTELQIYQQAQDWVIDAPSVFLDTPDIKTHSALRLRLSEGKAPHISLKATASDGVASSTPRYIPTMLKPQTIAWLNQAIQAGRVRSADAHIEGYLNELARNDSAATFLINADIADARLSYLKGWPLAEQITARLHMDGAQMDVEAEQVEALGLKPRQARARIANIRQPSIELWVDAPHSGVKNLLDYVHHSGISKIIQHVETLFVGTGQADVFIHLKKNLSAKHYSDLKPYFTGTARLQQAGLQLPSAGVRLAELDGVIRFSERHVHADSLAGTLNGQPFSASASTRQSAQGPRAELLLDTRLSLHDLIGDQAPLLTNNITGRSAWHAELELPLSGGQPSARLSVSGNLQGTTIALPEPLHKAASTAAATRAHVILNSHEANRIWLDYQGQMQGVLVFDRDGGGLYSGRIHYQRGKPALPRGAGIVVEAAVGLLDVDPWLDLLSEQGDAVIHDSPLQQLKLRADALVFKGVTAADGEVLLTQQPSHWHARVDSLGVKGSVSLFKDKAKPLQIHLTDVNLNQMLLPDGDQQSLGNPRAIPSSHITVDALRWEDIELDNIDAQVVAIASGIRISEYRIDDPYLSASGEGAWQSDEDGFQETLLEFSASSENVGKGLQKVGVHQLLKGGKGRFTGSLRWKKAPYQFDLPSLDGQVSATIRKSDLLAVKPGIAKLLGLLNIESLPKRLVLNFDDLSSKGLAFDKAVADVNIEHGIARIKHMKMDTDLATIELKGRADLVRQELEQIAKVNPDISNLLPLTVGAVGGIPGLVGVLLVDQVVKAFGGDADRVAQVRYKISGPWSDPKITATRIKRVKDLSPEQLRQRAEELVIKAQGVDYGQDVVPGELELDDDEEQSLFADD